MFVNVNHKPLQYAILFCVFALRRLKFYPDKILTYAGLSNKIHHISGNDNL